MASVNKVILIGNLGNDPEMRYLSDSTAVAKLSIATTDTWKDKNGEKQEKTEWHRVIFYRKLAEIAGEYLKKGRSVYIEGRLETRKWTDKQGIERYHRYHSNRHENAWQQTARPVIRKQSHHSKSWRKRR